MESYQDLQIYKIMNFKKSTFEPTWPPFFQSSPGGPVNQFKIRVSDLSDRVGEPEIPITCKIK
eukprot:SAG31_NODE_3656_length_4020_cov_2.852079_1_plen_63_part_00